MKAKRILSIAIIAALPFGAMAENISGAMYTAPSAANTNHPAPTTNAYAPYGRIDVDTADQDHIATTAYVKGAYNSAIAAVNKVADDRQPKLYGDMNSGTIYISDEVRTAEDIIDRLNLTGEDIAPEQDMLITSGAVLVGIKSQRAEVWTTWDDDTAKTEVAFVTAQ